MKWLLSNPSGFMLLVRSGVALARIQRAYPVSTKLGRHVDKALPTIMVAWIYSLRWRGSGRMGLTRAAVAVTGESKMFYLSATLAVIGIVGYNYFVKLIPRGIHPIVSVIGMYVMVLLLSIGLLPLFPPEGGIHKHFRQLNWIQAALAASVVLMELGFLLMYRYGWKLSLANLVAGTVANTLLFGLGFFLLGEKLSPTKGIGIALCISGIALISYRS